jgi:hypothetical protein
LQWPQDPCEVNGNNLNNKRREAITHFRIKKKKYLKDKNNELATSSKKKNIKDLYAEIIEVNGGYQSRSNLMKDETGDLLADFRNILKRRKNLFSQLLTVHRATDVRQTEVRTTEPLVSDPSPFEFEIFMRS